MRLLANVILVIFIWWAPLAAYAVPAKVSAVQDVQMIDRIQLVTEQIALLKNRLSQSNQTATALQAEHEKQISNLLPGKASKSLLEKAVLDMSVTRSSLDSINIELTDNQQMISWLEKNAQEYENQLNVINLFGNKLDKEKLPDTRELYHELFFQRKLLGLERSRVEYLKELQTVTKTILTLQVEKYDQLKKSLKSTKLLLIKQQQIQDELIYQQQQNYWLQELNSLYAKMAKLDPSRNRDAYASMERKIFYANEKANYAYTQSLIARYEDQIQQMHLTALKSNSVTLLGELGGQSQLMAKQIGRLNDVISSREALLGKHINYLSKRQSRNSELNSYIADLTGLHVQYAVTGQSIATISSSLTDFRASIDRELQKELSSRQGFPSFDARTLLDLGKEVLLVPALTFQLMKSLSGRIYSEFHSTSLLAWSIFAILEFFLIITFFTIDKLVSLWINLPSAWKGKLNAKWVMLRWLEQNMVDMFLLVNLVGCMIFFGIPFPMFDFLLYLSAVWLVFKNTYIGARLCLVETTHDTSGHDVRLFNRLRWFIIIGGVLTAMTVYIHQLPLIFELRTLCDRLFLLLLMIISLLILRSWHVLPDLILSSMDHRHPYFEKSVRFIGVLVPALVLANSLIGVFGYVNLIMTISRYEGLFLIVLVGYLMLRGLLTDALEQLSRLMIQYVHNGWLWTEAFLKPLDKVLRLALLLASGATLFLMYGWDKKSPIVTRLTGLMHYQMANVLNTTITPLSIIELFMVVSVFYWTAKWTREFVYRLLSDRTQDMGMRNSIAMLSQYSVIFTGLFLSLRVLGIDLRALAVVAGMLAFGIGFGLRDLATNFVCGFLILLERPLRVGDIVCINGIEGEVTHIGSRAVTVKTWDHMELLVPNAEIFYKAFTNWTARDNIIRAVTSIMISRHDNPHEVKVIIQNVVGAHEEVLKEPAPEVYLKNMSDSLIEFELRFYINIKRAISRTRVTSSVLMNIWDAFAQHGIQPPFPQQEIIIRDGENRLLLPKMELMGEQSS